MEDYDVLTGERTGAHEDDASSQSEIAGTNPGDGAETETDAAPEPTDEMIKSALADNIRNMTGGMFVYSAVNRSLAPNIEPQVFQVYRDKLLHDAGSPTDPLEVMLIEQLALAHFNIGRLHMKSCCVENPKLVIAYADSATRLLGEFRRCTLALEDFRAKQAARKERSASIDAAEMPAPEKHNGKPRPSTNGKPSANGKKTSSGKKKAHDSKLTANGEVPECIRQRMGYAANGASKQTAAIGSNGKG